MADNTDTPKNDPVDKDSKTSSTKAPKAKAETQKASAKSQAKTNAPPITASSSSPPPSSPTPPPTSSAPPSSAPTPPAPPPTPPHTPPPHTPPPHTPPPAPPPAPPPSTNSILLPTILASILGAAVGGSVAYFVANSLSSQLSQSLTDVQNSLRSEQSRRLDDGAETRSLIQNTQRSADAQIQQLLAQLSELERVAAENTLLQRRVNALEHSLAQIPDPSDIALNKNLRQTNQNVREIKALLDAPDNTELAAASLAASNILQAVSRGEPFTLEITLAQQTLGKNNPALLELAPFAPLVIPSAKRLVNQFPSLARDILKERSRIQNQDKTWAHKTFSKLSNLVSIRPKGDVKGQNPDAVLARAEQRLDELNLSAALSEILSLPKPLQQHANTWILNAQNRIQLDAAARKLAADINLQLKASANKTLR